MTFCTQPVCLVGIFFQLIKGCVFLPQVIALQLLKKSWYQSHFVILFLQLGLSEVSNHTRIGSWFNWFIHSIPRWKLPDIPSSPVLRDGPWKPPYFPGDSGNFYSRTQINVGANYLMHDTRDWELSCHQRELPWKHWANKLASHYLNWWLQFRC